jgi:hypothetical protein
MVAGFDGHGKHQVAQGLRRGAQILRGDGKTYPRISANYREFVQKNGGCTGWHG